MEHPTAHLICSSAIELPVRPIFHTNTKKNWLFKIFEIFKFFSPNIFFLDCFEFEIFLKNENQFFKMERPVIRYYKGQKKKRGKGETAPWDGSLYEKESQVQLWFFLIGCHQVTSDWLTIRCPD